MKVVCLNDGLLTNVANLQYFPSCICSFSDDVFGCECSQSHHLHLVLSCSVFRSQRNKNGGRGVHGLVRRESAVPRDWNAGQVHARDKGRFPSKR